MKWEKWERLIFMSRHYLCKWENLVCLASLFVPKIAHTLHLIYTKKKQTKNYHDQSLKKNRHSGPSFMAGISTVLVSNMFEFPFSRNVKHAETFPTFRINVHLYVYIIYIRIYVHIQFLHWLFRILTEKPTHTIFLVPATVHWSQFRKQNLYQNCASNAKACKSMFPLLALCQFVEICHSNLKSSLENNTLSYILLA